MCSVTKEFLKNTGNITTYDNTCILRKHIICNDGFCISVQASKFHYSIPRENLDDGEYSHVEVSTSFIAEENIEYGFTTYLDDFTNLGYYSYGVIGVVPIEVVDNVISIHGGIKTTA